MALKLTDQLKIKKNLENIFLDFHCCEENLFPDLNHNFKRINSLLNILMVFLK